MNDITRNKVYWIVNNCTSNCNWLVWSSFHEIISHTNKVCNIVLPTPTDIKLKYVLFSFLKDNSLLTLVKCNDFFMLIHNVKTTEEPASAPTAPASAPSADAPATSTKEITYSRIFVSNSLKDCISNIRKDDVHRIGIKKLKNLKFNSEQTKKLKGVIGWDLVDIEPSSPKYQELLTKFIKESGKTADFSGFQNLDLDILAKIPNASLETMIFNHSNINNFGYFMNFTGLSTLTLWNCNEITDDSLIDIHCMIPKIKNLEFHQCNHITARTLINLAKLNLLTNLIFDNSSMLCQETVFQTVIKDTEWQSIENYGVEFIAINSQNLTLDFVYHLLERFKSINFLMCCSEIHAKIYKNTTSGVEPTTVTFLNEKQERFTLNKTVRFKGLIRDAYDRQLYSESMLEKIKANNPSLYETAKTAVRY